MIRATLLLLTVGCGLPPAYVTGRGVAVNCEDSTLCPDKADVEAIVGIFVELVDSPHRLEEILSQANVDVYVEQVRCMKTPTVPSGRCDGAYDHKYTLKIKHSECIYRGGLLHELAHMYQRSIDLLPNGDSLHDDESFFGDGGVVSAGKSTAERILCK